MAEAEQNYTCARWHLPERGIWELSMEAHYVASKVMSWVVLERARVLIQKILVEGNMALSAKTVAGLQLRSRINFPSKKTSNPLTAFVEPGVPQLRTC
jgi:hypothetical protein